MASEEIRPMIVAPAETRIVQTPVGAFEVPIPVYSLMEAQRVTNVDHEAEVIRLRERVGANLSRAIAAEGRLEEFREQVRDMAIEKASELGWCDEGLNAALRELGLKPKGTFYDVTVRVYQDVTVRVHAEDDFEARRAAWNDNSPGDLVTSHADDYGWEMDSDWRNYEVEESDDQDD